MTTYRSSDGLMSSSDPQAVALWESICAEHASAQSRASAVLRAKGVKMEHPDDGWVNRDRNTVAPCYPRFDDGVSEGDLIALGWPSSGYRLVRCTTVERSGILVPLVTYSFEETGDRVDLVETPNRALPRWRRMIGRRRG